VTKVGKTRPRKRYNGKITAVMGSGLHNHTTVVDTCVCVLLCDVMKNIAIQGWRGRYVLVTLVGREREQ
jgi:hypothetical protein